MTLRAGDWVEVRSKDEILRTLDKNGRLETLPFMPQMFDYCGRRFRVYKRAHKTCDTVYPVRGRRLANSVHLELRCNGNAFGACQAACLIFWKEAWLKPVDSAAADAKTSAEGVRDSTKSNAGMGCTEEDVWKSTSGPDPQSQDGKRYFCQATELPNYTSDLHWWDIRQYVEDYTSGNEKLGRIVSGLIYGGYYMLTYRRLIGGPTRWLYDRFQALIGGVPYPRKVGKIPPDQPTPTCTLNLQPGELVRVKSHEEILATLDTTPKNRGLWFDAEQVPYCGGVYRVRARVERFLNERTGRVTLLKTPAVILEDVWCRSRYSDCRMFCPRSIYSWWREIWLERVVDGAPQAKPHS
jgi:hypothetical protein